MSAPTITVKLDDGTGTFPYDISGYVETGGGYALAITRGRADERGEVDASTCSLVLNNTDGRFSLGSTTIASPSPIYVDNQIRVTFTVGGTTVNRFTGFVQAWPVEWPGGGSEYAVAQITAVDRIARLNRKTLRSVVAETVLAYPADALYAMGEASGATTAGDTSGNEEALLQQRGTGTAVSFGDGGATFAGGKFLEGALTSTASDLAVGFTITTSTVSRDVLGWIGTSSAKLVALDGSGRVTLSNDAPLIVNDWTITGTTNVANGALHTVVIYDDGSQINLVVDGSVEATRASSMGLSGDDPIFVGNNGVPANVGGTFGYSYGTTMTGTLANVFFADGLSAGDVSDYDAACRTGFADESSDDRVSRYATFGAVDPADMTLETGLQESVPALEITGMSPWAAIQEVVRAEGGLAFIDGSGDLVFQNRSHRARQAAALTLTVGDIGDDSRISVDMQQVFNIVTATRPNGATQVAKDATSIGTHGDYPTSLDLLVTTDDQAIDAARWVIYTSAEPDARLTGVRLDLRSAGSTFQQDALNLEISDRLAISGLPSQSPSISDLIVEGWTETYSVDEWSMVLNTSPGAKQHAWILDDATYGVLDGNNRILN